MVDLNFFKGKKIFITGHTGFKGSWLTYILYLSGAKITGYSLKPKNKNDNFNLLKLEKKNKKLLWRYKKCKIFKKVNFKMQTRHNLSFSSSSSGKRVLR